MAAAAQGHHPCGGTGSSCRAPSQACSFRTTEQSARTSAREYVTAVQLLLRTSKSADLQPNLWHPYHPLVHSGCRGVGQHDPVMVIRPPPSCSLDTRRTCLVLPWHNHFRDCPDGSPLPRRIRHITRCVPTDLPSGDATVARARPGVC